MSALTIDMEVKGDTVVLRLLGEFDLAGVREFHRVSLEVQQRSPRRICIDLRELGFMGASGLRSLLEIQARANRDSFDLVVVKGPPMVQRVFEMTGCDRRVTLIEDPAV